MGNTKKRKKMSKVIEFESLLASFKEDYEKFNEKKNKTAGTRARKTLQEIRNWAKDVRMEISETKKEQVTA